MVEVNNRQNYRFTQTQNLRSKSCCIHVPHLWLKGWYNALNNNMTTWITHKMEDEWQLFAEEELQDSNVMRLLLLKSLRTIMLRMSNDIYYQAFIPLISFAVELTIMQSALASAAIMWHYSCHSYTGRIIRLFPWNLDYRVQALPYCNSCIYTISLYYKNSA